VRVPGEALDGVNLFYGIDVAELAKTENFVSLLGFPCRGAPFNHEETELLNRVLICGIAADPRIWIPKIAALLGNAGCTAALSAAFAAQVGSNNGGDVASAATEFFIRVAGAGIETIDEMVVFLQNERSKGIVACLGVPFRKEDERLTAALLAFRNVRPQSRFLKCSELVRAAAACIGVPANITLAFAAVATELQVSVAGAAVLASSTIVLTSMSCCAAEASYGNCHPWTAPIRYAGPERRRLS
jgi:hypothetical protein